METSLRLEIARYLAVNRNGSGKTQAKGLSFKEMSTVDQGIHSTNTSPGWDDGSAKELAASLEGVSSPWSSSLEGIGQSVLRNWEVLGSMRDPVQK